MGDAVESACESWTDRRPKGEARGAMGVENSGERRTTICHESRAGRPRHYRKETCHFAKRTHFVFEEFLLYRLCSKELMPFAVAFANGFVLEKRTHLEGVG